MKEVYVKTLLYAYPNIQKIINRIDELVEKKAIESMVDYTSCKEQCDKIIKLTIQKGILFEIKHYLSKILIRLGDEQVAYVEHKYFKKDKKQFEGIDFSSRNYFRKQKRLIKYFGECLEWLNLSDGWFEKKCRRVPYINKLYSALMANVSGKDVTKKTKNVKKDKVA